MGIPNGGTNATSMANTFGVNYYDGTSIVTTPVGTATFVLTSNGAGLAPTFQAAAASGVSSAIGTANQINVSAATGAVTFTLSSTAVMPGTFTSTNGQNNLGALDTQGTTSLNTTGTAGTTIGNTTSPAVIIGGRPIGTTITGAGTLSSAYNGSYANITGTGYTITLDNSMPVGTEIDFFYVTGGTITFAATGTIQGVGALSLTTAFTGASAKLVSGPTWQIVGALT